jgi:hypothetical protein
VRVRVVGSIEGVYDLLRRRGRQSYSTKLLDQYGTSHISRGNVYHGSREGGLEGLFDFNFVSTLTYKDSTFDPKPYHCRMLPFNLNSIRFTNTHYLL